MTDRSFRLMEAHQRIDETLRMETRRRWPDLFRVMRLKRIKLAIKDRLTGIAKRRREPAS